MKKYLFGLFAITLAIGFSAFTVASKAKKTSFLYFEFQGDNESEFGTAAKWIEADPLEVNCGDVEVEETVCTLSVDQSVATSVTDATSLAAHINFYTLDSYVKIDNAQNRGLDVMDPKERIE